MFLNFSFVCQNNLRRSKTRYNHAVPLVIVIISLESSFHTLFKNTIFRNLRSIGKTVSSPEVTIMRFALIVQWNVSPLAILNQLNSNLSSSYDKWGLRNTNRIQFFNMCLRSQDRHCSIQRMEFSTLALHIFSSVLDIKILNMIHMHVTINHEQNEGRKV